MRIIEAFLRQSANKSDDNCSDRESNRQFLTQLMRFKDMVGVRIRTNKFQDVELGKLYNQLICLIATERDFLYKC